MRARPIAKFSMHILSDAASIRTADADDARDSRPSALSSRPNGKPVYPSGVLSERQISLVVPITGIAVKRGFMPGALGPVYEVACEPSPLESTRILVVHDAWGDCRWQAPADDGASRTIAATSWPKEANLQTGAPTWPVAPVTRIIVSLCVLA
jgi:hypothetical protein